MSSRGIKAPLELIVPRLVSAIMSGYDLSETEALTRLYQSELYSRLEQEGTKLWHLSVPTLYSLWDEEQRTGEITYPEEA
ncbi:hypothetical protein AALA61_12605 [Oscillospiraceae bacterium 42-9]|uniref:hypothetical protein n=1 Tax=Acutalibacter sp. 1XD8-36 TaxID=2320852 RepID=UPI001411E60F|nr:hypothetical protein [Acutalibacter sp. 1XD8-36]NBJ90150.1 hypothetical protein [Acutalibacter sp. 1XD8-36]